MRLRRGGQRRSPKSPDGSAILSPRSRSNLRLRYHSFASADHDSKPLALFSRLIEVTGRSFAANFVLRSDRWAMTATTPTGQECCPEAAVQYPLQSCPTFPARNCSNKLIGAVGRLWGKRGTNNQSRVRRKAAFSNQNCSTDRHASGRRNPAGRSFARSSVARRRAPFASDAHLAQSNDRGLPKCDEVVTRPTRRCSGCPSMFASTTTKSTTYSSSISPNSW
jgi:hypothetical protein